MIDVMQAVSAAERFLRNFPNLLTVNSPRLEETDVDDVTSDFLITISVLDNDSPFSGLGMGKPQRIYKQVRISSETGEVKALNDRTLAEA